MDGDKQRYNMRSTTNNKHSRGARFCKDLFLNKPVQLGPRLQFHSVYRGKRTIFHFLMKIIKYGF